MSTDRGEQRPPRYAEAAHLDEDAEALEDPVHAGDAQHQHERHAEHPRAEDVGQPRAEDVGQPRAEDVGQPRAEDVEPS